MDIDPIPPHLDSTQIYFHRVLKFPVLFSLSPVRTFYVVLESRCGCFYVGTLRDNQHFLIFDVLDCHKLNSTKI